MNIDPPKKSSFAKLSPSQSNINFNWLDWDSFNSDYFYPHPHPHPHPPTHPPGIVGRAGSARLKFFKYFCLHTKFGTPKKVHCKGKCFFDIFIWRQILGLVFNNYVTQGWLELTSLFTQKILSVSNSFSLMSLCPSKSKWQLPQGRAQFRKSHISLLKGTSVLSIW